MERRELLMGMGAAAMIAAVGAGEAAAQVTGETVYELRIYHLNEGKQALIEERFKSKEVAIFERLGMHSVGYWSATDAPLAGQTLIYMMRHKSRAAANESWAKFNADPEWLALKAATEKDGPYAAKLESTFMKLTDFSPKV